MSPDVGERHTWQKSILCMGTVVHIQVVSTQSAEAVNVAINRAFDVFRWVEGTCSRFDASSELTRLVQTVGDYVQVSDLLFEAIRFAVEVADATGGRFDPTVGHALESMGFNRHYLTGDALMSGFVDTTATYRDIQLDATTKRVLLHKPMRIDLGAVAKGLAVDLARKELSLCEGYVIDAGGDLYLAGLNEIGGLWQIGIQHPLYPEQHFCELRLTDVAVCTSGSYERKSPTNPNTHHIIDPHTKHSTSGVLSCTAIGPFAMMADAFSTAGFLSGCEAGVALLQQVGLEGMFISDTLEPHMTNQMKRYIDG